MEEVLGQAREYPTPEYANLMKTLKQTRKSFLGQREEKFQDERKVTAKKELDAWL